jgi:NADP-dependent 3-hydroxy acid dehydrogenase YdfG
MIFQPAQRGLYDDLRRSRDATQLRSSWKAPFARLIANLAAGDIAEILIRVASRPAHINIDELFMKPVNQAAIGKVYRRVKK